MPVMKYYNVVRLGLGRTNQHNARMKVIIAKIVLMPIAFTALAIWGTSNLELAWYVFSVAMLGFCCAHDSVALPLTYHRFLMFTRTFVHLVLIVGIGFWWFQPWLALWIALTLVDSIWWRSVRDAMCGLTF